MIQEDNQKADSAVLNTLYGGLKPFLGPNVSLDNFAKQNIQGSKRVDPTISDDLKTGAKWATFWSLLIIRSFI